MTFQHTQKYVDTSNTDEDDDTKNYLKLLEETKHVTPDGQCGIRSSIIDGVPHSAYQEKHGDNDDLKERLMVDIFSKIKQEQIDDKQKRIIASANTVAAKKNRE